jgi:hypothetical protein
MNGTRKLTLIFALSATASLIPGLVAAGAQATDSSAKAMQRAVGAITAISGNSITLKTDNDGEMTVVVDDDTRMVRTAPGQKDLSGATPIHLQDLQVGDRVLARFVSSDDGKNQAKAVIAMKQTDIAEKQGQERQDWQRRGVGGLVKSVDPATHIVVITIPEPGGAKSLNIHAAAATIVRRYSPDSVKFDDAKAGTLEQIKPGDQLRARGDRSADGNDLTADEIVSGAFRNVAATVISVDPAAGTIGLTDLATKKPVVIRVTAESQLRRLPPMMAQGIAMRLKGGAGGANAGGSAANASPASSSAPASGSADHVPHNGNQPRGTAGNGGPGRTGDMQQMLSRAPTIPLTDLKKGDAVMVVATQGTDSTPATAITLLAGVEPMLQASTSASQSMLMASWNLNSNGGQDAQQ